MDTKYLESLRDRDFINCKKCGKRVWKYWKSTEIVKNSNAKNLFVEMTECAPCHFKHKR